MKVIVFAATKGGTGKTTLTYNVALEAAKKHQVLISDLDPQMSLKTMWDHREETANPRFVSNPGSMPQAVKLLTELGYDRELMFVDTPGSMMHVIKDAISVADLVVLPVQPSPMDWAAQEAVADLVSRMGLADKTMIVINRAEGRSELVERTEQHFKPLTKMPIVIVKSCADYARAVEHGKSAAELGNKEAGKEIRDIWAQISSHLDLIQPPAAKPVIQAAAKKAAKELSNDRKVH